MKRRLLAVYRRLHAAHGRVRQACDALRAAFADQPLAKRTQALCLDVEVTGGLEPCGQAAVRRRGNGLG